jgi:hypothetical protein
VELGKNAGDPCAMLSEAYGGEAMKNSNLLNMLFPNKEKVWYRKCSKYHR